MVGLTKIILNKLEKMKELNFKTMNDFEFRTALNIAMNMLNNRPLCKMTIIENGEFLTPKHFLMTKINSRSLVFCMQTRSEIARALKECHDSKLGEHRSAAETLFKLKNLGVLWPKMAKDVKEYVEKCDLCQRNKISTYLH